MAVKSVSSPKMPPARAKRMRPVRSVMAAEEAGDADVAGDVRDAAEEADAAALAPHPAAVRRAIASLPWLPGRVVDDLARVRNLPQAGAVGVDDVERGRGAEEAA
jgi:hypothetical protein